MYSCGPPLMDVQEWDDQHELTYSSYVRTRGCNPEDLPEAMNDREKWRETVRDIRAGGVTWWWWYIYRNPINFHMKSSVNILCAKKGLISWNFWNSVFPFINQSAHSNLFLNFELLRRQQYLAYNKNFEGSNLKII